MRTKEYLKRPFMKWDGKTPLCLFNDDTYFFGEDDIIDYLEFNDLTINDIELMICKPHYLTPIYDDYWEDILPEDKDLKDICSKEFMEALITFNEILKDEGVISWSEGKFRTEVTL